MSVHPRKTRANFEHSITIGGEGDGEQQQVLKIERVELEVSVFLFSF
jgi:hypothetical protein